ncbi:MAG: DUF421 domain-containing protein [Oscillospiraceae bacterium]|nr:DUF421 domain-containing protein [Oscillospiraceae bacterium]
MIVKIILLSAFSFVTLFFIAKLIGNKQMSQLNVYDFIYSITIGNIAAEMATSLKDNWLEPFTAMLFYGCAIFLISLISMKSIKARKFLSGRPLILYENGKLYEKNLFKAKLDITEFQMLCRNGGYFNIADVETAILETNGKISFLPVAARKPLTPEAMQGLPAQPKQEKITANIILDGNILDTNLHYLGKNRIWLSEKLNTQGYSQSDITKISLATCDGNGDVSIYRKINRDEKKDLFE